MDLSKPEQKQPKITAYTSDSQMNKHVVPTPPNKTPPVNMVGDDEAIPQQGGLVGSQSTPVDAPITPRQRTGRAGASVPVFGDWNDLNPGLADCYTLIFNKLQDEKLADGYRYLSNHPSVDRESCIKPNEDINSTHPRNSNGHLNKQLKQGRCFSCLFR